MRKEKMDSASKTPQAKGEADVPPCNTDPKVESLTNGKLTKGESAKNKGATPKEKGVDKNGKLAVAKEKRKKRAKPLKGILKPLNIFGLGALEPIILAALADARPLLLIGPHGSAKTALLNRLARSLGLNHGHFNASLISFDDLMGYPAPSEDGEGIKFIQTPGSIWGKESILIDEINRCRPETQNKFFGLVHEKRIQGLALEGLVYRWAAMNPPPPMDDLPEHETIYEGVRPLDIALADRFSYVVEFPTFDEFTKKDRLLIVSKGGDVGSELPDISSLVKETAIRIEQTPKKVWAWVARYAEALVFPLRDAGYPISGRRAGEIARSVVSVGAAQSLLNRRSNFADSALLALRWGLPHRAQGKSISWAKLGAIHKEALKSASGTPKGPWGAIRQEKDVVKKIALALSFLGKEINKFELSQLVCDAFASIDEVQKRVMSVLVFPILAQRDAVTASTYELLSKEYKRVIEYENLFEGDSIPTFTCEEKPPDEFIKVLSPLKKGTPFQRRLFNTLLTCLGGGGPGNRLFDRNSFDLEPVILRAMEWHGAFAGEDS